MSKLLQLFKWTAAVISIFASSNLLATDPQKMAVLVVESALDYQDPTLQKVLDFNTLKKYKILTPEHPEGISLYDLNQQLFFQKQQDLLNYGETAPLALWDLYVRSLSQSGKLAIVKSLSNLNEQKMIVESFQRSVKKGVWQKHLTSAENNLLGELTHGTHVSGLFIQDLETKVRLINLPLPGFEFRGQTVNQVMSNVLNSLRSMVNTIGNISLLENVKVLNLSGGFSSEDINRFIANAVANGRIPQDVAEKLNIDQILKISSTVFLTLLNQNPDLSFALAAGNEGKDLAELPSLPNFLKHPNVVVVGSTTNQHGISVFSNRHSKLIDILTEGEMVPSLAPLLPNIHFLFSGTSMATPRVGNRLIRIRLQEPTLTAANAKQVLLEHESRPIEKLIPYSNQGKVMMNNTNLAKISFTSSIDKATCKRIYFSN